MRHRYQLSILAVLLLICSEVAIAGNGYRTDLLQRMAEAMAITEGLQTLKDGEYYRHLLYNNRDITVIVDQKEVTHIGFSLFTPIQRRMVGVHLCNFLERYSLEITLPMKRQKSVARQLEEDGIFFRKGTFDVFRKLQQDTTYAVGVECLSGKRYTVSWSKNGREEFAVNFPVEHELLMGTNMLENERRIAEYISQSSKAARLQLLPDTTQLRLTWQGKYFVLPGDHFYTKQLNNSQYYEKTGTKRYQLLYNPTFVTESLSNLMTTAAIENDFDLQLRIIKYGFVQDTIQVKLNQWLNYGIGQGCTPYFGMIAIDRNLADCEIIMRNAAMGYIHVMRLTFDISTLEDRKGLIKARLNSYVPTTRVQYLFDELKK